MSLAAYFTLATAGMAVFAATGAAALLAVVIMALVIASHQALMLIALVRSRPDDSGRSPAQGLHYWCFAIAVLLFGLGAGVALYDGAGRFTEARVISRPGLAYALLITAVLGCGAVAWAALIAFNRCHPDDAPAPRAVRAVQHPALFAVIIDSAAAIVGISLALVGILAADTLKSPSADGLAAIGIGLVMALAAATMSIEVKGLMTAAAPPADVNLRGDLEVSKPSITTSPAAGTEQMPSPAEPKSTPAKLPPATPARIGGHGRKGRRGHR